MWTNWKTKCITGWEFFRPARVIRKRDKNPRSALGIKRFSAADF